MNSQLRVLGFFIRSSSLVVLPLAIRARLLVRRIIHAARLEVRAFFLTLENIDLIFQPRNGFLQQNDTG